MKLLHYPETDSLYIELKAGPGSETRRVAPGVNADLAADGTIVGLDIDGASKLDLGTLEAQGVPLTTLKARSSGSTGGGASYVPGTDPPLDMRYYVAT